MTLLLDTHTLLWWSFGDPQLSQRVRTQLEANIDNVFVSAVSAMEITTKYRIGKLPGAAVIALDVSAAVADLGFHELPISLAETALAGRMEGSHRDPFDRLLIAQGLLNNLTIVSNDQKFDAFGVARLW